MKEFVLGLILLFALSGHGHAQSTKAQQEKCVHEARRNFERKYCGDQSQIYPSGCFVMDLFGSYYWSYEAHYNKKLDKCFLLANGHTSVQSQQRFNDYLLVDVFDEKVYGIYFARIGYGENRFLYSDVAECSVGDKKCKSLVEFENLIRPYIEE
ncbi:MAG TPA: hypothetical protein VLW47_09555 [Thermodesulfobacteriota bacterium]|nr:hypothetical protein [Thermodesulfobacteriota bacterium]